MGLFTTKSLDIVMAEADETGIHSLKKTLGPFALISLGLGSIIGAAVFTLTAQTAAKHSGPAVPLSFVLAAISCSFAGLCYAELSSMLPIAGSAYTYAYATMGELFAWVVGWDLILEYLIGAATAAASWSVMYRGTMDTLGVSPLHETKFDLPGLVLVLLISAVLVRGIKESGNFNNTMVLIKLAVIVGFVAIGARTISAANYVPFIPRNTGLPGEFGWSGILRGAGIIYFCYIGFDSITTTAQEAKNPQRDLPLAIFGTLIIATILYAAFSIVLVGNISYRTLAADMTLTGSYKVMFSRRVALLLSFGTLAGLIPVVLVMVLGQSRVLYSMARDNLLPQLFAKIHPRWRTPVPATLCCAGFTAAAAAFFPLRLLAELTSIGTLFAFTVVCVAVLILRSLSPERPRPFRVPFQPFVSIAGVCINVGLMMGLSSLTWLRFAVWLFIGLVFYFLYGRSHSKLRTDEA